MPRYYFNVRDGIDVPDNIGTELPDLRSARREAYRVGASLIAAMGDTGMMGHHWWVDVADKQGTVLLRLHLSMMQSGETSGKEPELPAASLA